MRFINISLVLLLGLALIGCAARAGTKTEAAYIVVKDTVAACSQSPNCICEQKPAPKRERTFYRTAKPSPQSNEVYVYCGDSSQQSMPLPTNGKDLPPRQSDSTARTSDEGKHDCETHKLKLGWKDFSVELESPSAYIYLGTIFLIVLILAFLKWFVTKKAKETTQAEDAASKSYKASTEPVVIVGFLLIAILAYMAVIIQPSPKEYRDAVEEAISERHLEEKVTSLVNTQLREELQQCTLALQKSEIRTRGLEATTESWPFTRGTPYALFGAAVGLIVGMLVCIPLDVLLSVRRRRYRSDSALDELLDELQKELVSKEKETIQEILRQRRDQTASKPGETTSNLGGTTSKPPA